MTAEKESIYLENFCHDRSRLERVAPGQDGVFYRYGQLGISVYEDIKVPWGQQLGLLTRYKDLMNTGAEKSESECWEFSFGKVLGRFKVRINPFIDLVRCQEHSVCVGSKPFIEGQNLAYRYEFFDPLVKLTRVLRKDLDASGIKLLPLNLIEVADRTLIITDLCSHISRL